MDADRFFQTLFDDFAINGQWIRGNVIDIILFYHEAIRNVRGMKWPMTEDIPQRPTDEEVKDLIFNYTPLPRAQVQEYFAKVPSTTCLHDVSRTTEY